MKYLLKMFFVVFLSKIASDGTYLYIYTKKQGLLKLGTGLNKSIRGHVYAQNSRFGFCMSHPLIKPESEDLIYVKGLEPWEWSLVL